MIVAEQNFLAQRLRDWNEKHGEDFCASAFAPDL